MFLMFVWMITCIAGSVSQGQMDFVRTHLTVDHTAAVTTITVASTEGFPTAGIIVWEEERTAYSDTTDTTFVGTIPRPLIRGTSGTEAVAHSEDVQVTTVPGAMMNSSASYNIAAMADSSGLIAFVSVPLAFFSLLGSFFFLPLQFLGTDLQILTFFWAIIGVGMIASLTIALAGGRRV